MTVTVSVMPELAEVRALARLGFELVLEHLPNHRYHYAKWEELGPDLQRPFEVLVEAGIDGCNLNQAYERMIDRCGYPETPFFMLHPDGQDQHRLFYSLVKAALRVVGVIE